MSEGFTPGPWALRRSRTGSSHTHIECPADESLAVFKRVEDAQLAVAARDLLEQLEETHAALCFTPDYIGSARYNKNAEAILKARGTA